MQCNAYGNASSVNVSTYGVRRGAVRCRAASQCNAPHPLGEKSWKENILAMHAGYMAIQKADVSRKLNINKVVGATASEG